jgi:hypothetical protein
VTLVARLRGFGGTGYQGWLPAFPNGAYNSSNSFQTIEGFGHG